jgi:iron complex outermembrane recepter protein
MGIDSKITALLGACVIAASPASLYAQDVGAAKVTPPDEIVVTARRREENAQTVPLAIKVLDAATLDRRSIVSLAEITTATPGLRFTSQGGSELSDISMRGLAQNVGSSTSIPAVVTYVAEVPLVGQATGGSIYDIGNVQILKGPQGTLFGRNTIGGAVLITPRAPTYEFGGYARASAGNYDYLSTEGAVSVPIVDGKLALRMAGQLNRRDGFAQDIVSGRRLGDIHQNAIRASLLFEPMANLRNTLIYDYYKSTSNGDPYTIYRVNLGVVPILDPALSQALAAQQARGPFKVENSLQDSFVKHEVWGITNTTSFDIGDVTLKNIFGYRTNNYQIRGGTDGLPPLTVGGVVQPITLYKVLRFINDDEQLTDELQVQGKTFNDKLTYIGGVFYLNSKPRGITGTQYHAFDFFGSAPPSSSSPYLHVESLAAFGQITYDLSKVLDGLKFNLGGRYTWTTQELCGAVLTNVVNINSFYSEDECRALAASGSPGRGILKAREQNPTWTVGFDYQATPDTFFYVTSRRGVREGGINSPKFNSPFTSSNIPGVAVDISRFQTFSAETVTDVELGMKTNWQFGEVRGRFNIAAFRNWYAGAVNFFSVAGFITPDAGYPNQGAFGYNSGDLVLSGIEVEGSISPVRDLVLSYSGSFLDQRVDSVSSLAPFPTPSVTLPSPKWSYSLATDYTLPVQLAKGDISLHADYYWTGNYQAQGAPIPGYGIANLRLDWRNIRGSSVNLAFFMKNMFDKEYISNATLALEQFPVSAAVYGEPRTFGVQANVDF